MTASFACNAAAKADTYVNKIVYVSSGATFAAADDFGDYVISTPGTLACEDDGLCYLVNVGGTEYNSPTIPQLGVDPGVKSGSGCNVASAGYYTVATMCNNGYEFLLAYATQISGFPSIFSASDPLHPIGSGGAEFNRAILTDNGSLYYINANNDTLNVALNTTTTIAATPEPSSFALLLTGAMGLQQISRRRRS